MEMSISVPQNSEEYWLMKYQDEPWIMVYLQEDVDLWVHFIGDGSMDEEPLYDLIKDGAKFYGPMPKEPTYSKLKGSDYGIKTFRRCIRHSRVRVCEDL